MGPHSWCQPKFSAHYIDDTFNLKAIYNEKLNTEAVVSDVGRKRKKPQKGLIHWCAGGIGVRHVIVVVVQFVVN